MEKHCRRCERTFNAETNFWKDRTKKDGYATLCKECAKNPRKRPKTPEGRFWSYVDKSSDCWEWTGGVISTGYGNFWWDEKTPNLRPHVYSWEIANGKKRGEGLVIAHHCDNRLCVNPKHLYETTHKGNIEDREKRMRSFENNARKNAKLTAEEAQAIIDRRSRGEKQIDLAREYGIAKNSVWNIVTGRTWPHLYRQGGGQ